MLVFKKTTQIQEAIEKISKKNIIGFVPTMGALHQGHLSLIKQAKKNNDYVVVSIFVNPTQFDNIEDLVKYPKTLKKDLKLLKSVNCDFVYVPSVGEVYPNKVVSKSFKFDGLEHQMEGQHRKGHFDGVGTVVKRLFEIVKPDNAYFGEKDFQQLQIIKKMVEKHHIPLNIIGCPIFREDDGLAMSSRNARLTKEYRKEAPFIYKTLKQARINFKTQSAQKVSRWVEQQFKKNDLLKLEYFTIAEVSTLKTVKRKHSTNHYRGFIAAYAGKIRLIDNIEL